MPASMFAPGPFTTQSNSGRHESGKMIEVKRSGQVSNSRDYWRRFAGNTRNHPRLVFISGLICRRTGADSNLLANMGVDGVWQLRPA